MSSADRSNVTKDQLKEIARAAAQRSAVNRAAEIKRLEQTKLEHERRFANGVLALQSSIIPLLEQAKLAFESERVPVEIITNFDSSSAPQAQVVFACSGSYWSNSHGNVELAVSESAIFCHDGTDFYVAIAKSFSTQASGRTRIQGEVAPQVLAAVEMVIDSFFHDVERKCRY